MHFIPMPCMHCDSPPCTKVCPVAATYKNPEGIVAQVYPRCIGVRMCISNCPYTVRYFNWYPPTWPHEYEKGLNPEVYRRRKGITEKCNFCIQRIRRAKMVAKKEKRVLRDGDIIPACVETCPSEAMYFGDLNNPESRVSKLSRSRRAFRLMEELGTEPKVYYLKEGEWIALSLSMPSLAEESAGGSSEATAGQTEGQATKPAESGTEKPQETEEEPGCSD